jgi:Holliday junction resolvase
MINSRQKGASFEREVAKALTAEGFPAKRGA